MNIERPATNVKKGDVFVIKGTALYETIGFNGDIELVITYVMEEIPNKKPWEVAGYARYGDYKVFDFSGSGSSGIKINFKGEEFFSVYGGEAYLQMSDGRDFNVTLGILKAVYEFCVEALSDFDDVKSIDISTFKVSRKD